MSENFWSTPVGQQIIRRREARKKKEQVSDYEYKKKKWKWMKQERTNDY